MEQVLTELREEQPEPIRIETLLHYLEILVKGRLLITVIFSIITFITLLYVLKMPSIYVAKTTILPARSDNSSPLKGLAGASAQLMGFNLSAGGDISLLYKPIVESRIGNPSHISSIYILCPPNEQSFQPSLSKFI